MLFRCNTPEKAIKQYVFLKGNPIEAFNLEIKQGDYVDERYRMFPGEDLHTGCTELLKTINQRLINLKLHVSGHIHDNYGIKLEKVSNTRHVLFCNAAVLDNKYNFLTKYVHTLYL